MAGIVASTLRRKAFHRGARGSDQSKFTLPGLTTSTTAQTSDATAASGTTGQGPVGGGNVGGAKTGGPPVAGHAASYSPGGSRPSSRSSSFAFRSAELDDLPRAVSGGGPGGQLGGGTAQSCNQVSIDIPTWGVDLSYEDFWPTCINPTDSDLRLVRFETFDTLIPRVNSWLLVRSEIRVVKCETLEKKVTSVNHVTENSIMFVPSPDGIAICVKGLRLWYVTQATCNGAGLSTDGATVDKHATGSATTPGGGSTTGTSTVVPEIGYMNVIPKCNEWVGPLPVYECLPETYAAINTYLADQPLEGKILTVETVPIRLGSHQQKRPQIDADQTCFTDGNLRHVVYITRIFFTYGEPQKELIGAQDFLPEYQTARNWSSFRPSYCQLSSAMRKVKEWIKHAKHVSVTNIQTLEVVCKKNTENVHTGSNFVDHVTSPRTKLVRFVRVTYVRRPTSHRSTARPPTGIQSAISTGNNNNQASGFSYRTFTPAPVKVAMCSGQPEYEPLTSTWLRVAAWLKAVNRNVIGVESIVHPLRLLWQDQDGAETTVIDGDYRAPHSRRSASGLLNPCNSQQSYVELIRVYLNDEYHEPTQTLLPAMPVVEEVKDCACIIT